MRIERHCNLSPRLQIFSSHSTAKARHPHQSYQVAASNSQYEALRNRSAHGLAARASKAVGSTPSSYYISIAARCMGNEKHSKKWQTNLQTWRTTPHQLYALCNYIHTRTRLHLQLDRRMTCSQLMIQSCLEIGSRLDIITYHQHKYLFL